MKLVIAEKAMLGRDIARALCGREVSETARLPISGNGYTVIACSGHIMELVPPDEVNPDWGKPWRMEQLPIEIPNWQVRPASRNASLVAMIGDMLKECDSVIHAGDPDDEGQLIVDEVLDYFGYTGKVERVFVNDNIEKNIRKAFNELVPNEQCRGVGRAAYGRAMADFCFGINESRLATLRLGSRLSVGRVQTPTLGLVVNRDRAIENHEVRKFYELEATAAVDDANLSALFKFKPTESILAGEKHVFSPEVYEKQTRGLNGARKPFNTEVKEERKFAPLPYNLTVLQADMSRRFGFSANDTLEITQALRDKYKAITYNRADCQYLKSEHYDQAQTVLTCAMDNLGETWALDFSIKSKAFNDANVSAHHGIIPQESSFDVNKLTERERKVYTAIVERYAMQFLPPARFQVATSRFDGVDGEGIFECVQKRMIDAGYRGVFGSAVEVDEDDEAAGALLSAGEHIAHDFVCNIVEKETNPPKPYTEGTLITDMASISKYVTDPEIREILKRKDDGKKGEHGGIGTVATRASIIERLKDAGYIETVKGKVRSTSKGREFFDLIPAAVKGADVTAKWWLLQQDVADGKADANVIQHSVVEVFREHMDSAYVGKSIASAENNTKIIGKCPRCGRNVVERNPKAKKYACESNKWQKQDDGTWLQTEGCGFELWKTVCSKKIPAGAVKQMLENGRTSKPVQGLKSKAGKPFAAILVLDKDTGKVSFEFDNSAPRGRGNGKGKGSARRS